MLELKVEGMTCGGCAARVTKAVRSVDDAARIEIDVARRIVRVDSGAGTEAVKSALAAAGYPATDGAPD